MHPAMMCALKIDLKKTAVCESELFLLMHSTPLHLMKCVPCL